jgi:hypothetical protein
MIRAYIAGVALLAILIGMGGLYVKGRADGHAVAGAEWSLKFDRLQADMQALADRERHRQTLAAEAARQVAETLTAELEATRDQTEIIMEDLRRERAKDAAAAVLVPGIDGVCRFNKAAGHPCPPAAAPN